MCILITSEFFCCMLHLHPVACAPSGSVSRKQSASLEKKSWMRCRTATVVVVVVVVVVTVQSGNAIPRLNFTVNWARSGRRISTDPTSRRHVRRCGVITRAIRDGLSRRGRTRRARPFLISTTNDVWIIHCRPQEGAASAPTWLPPPYSAAPLPTLIKPRVAEAGRRPRSLI